MEAIPTRRRKRRNDRNHVIYLATSPEGKRYVGVTFARRRAYLGSMRTRWEAHVRNATVYDHDTLLCCAIREHGSGSFALEILEVVRGKQNAHDRERELLREVRPELNMEGMGRKANSKEGC